MSFETDSKAAKSSRAKLSVSRRVCLPFTLRKQPVIILTKGT